MITILRFLKYLLSFIPTVSRYRRTSEPRLPPSALAPSVMDKLPNELLSYIFSLLMSPPGQDPSFVVIISHVCSGWRKVSLATGSLWARIKITLPLNEPQQNCTETYLNRSVPYSLEISIDVRDPHWDWNEDSHPATWRSMIQTLHLVILHSPRWRTFEMLSDNWDPIFTFLFYTKMRMFAPRLEELSLSRCNAFLAASGQRFHPESLKAPIRLLGGRESALDNLTAVALAGVHVEWQNSALRNLRRLEFKYHSSDVMPNAEQFGRIVEDSPALESLAIVGWGPTLDDDDVVVDSHPKGRFLFPALKEFTFGFVDVGYAARLLSLFRVPALQALALEDIKPLVSPADAAGQDATPLLNLLSSSSSSSPSSANHEPSTAIHLPPIVRLELRRVRAEKSAFSNFFGKLVHLRQLSYVDMSDDALGCLCVSETTADSGGFFFSELAELRCVDVNPGALVRLVRNLKADGGGGGVALLRSLQKITISLSTQPSLSVMNMLQSVGIEVIELGHDD